MEMIKNQCYWVLIFIGLMVRIESTQVITQVISRTSCSMAENFPPPIYGRFKYQNFTNLPTSIDWRKKGAVTAVKDQGDCSGCWAFATVGAIEGINQIISGNLVNLSSQQLIDCDSRSYKCKGGFFEMAFRYVVSNEGLTTDEDYPYKAKNGTCDAQKQSSKVVTISGYELVPPNEGALMKSVANQPVAAAIAVDDHYAFYRYTKGVFKGPCGTGFNHEVLVVGYGTTKDGTDYWIVKNSWGHDWGQKGYILMQRGVGNNGLCGIAKRAGYPSYGVRN